MYEISVAGTFNATHALKLADGTREPLHGHDWQVSVDLAAEALDSVGFVADFCEVQRVLNAALGELHHQDLNSHPWFRECNPSAENVARVIYEKLRAAPAWGPRVRRVSVVEAPGCSARFVVRGGKT